MTGMSQKEALKKRAHILVLLQERRISSELAENRDAREMLEDAAMDLLQAYGVLHLPEWLRGTRHPKRAMRYGHSKQANRLGMVKIRNDAMEVIPHILKLSEKLGILNIPKRYWGDDEQRRR